MTSRSRRVVVVANRLPVSFNEESGGWDTSPGGLVSALTPILQRTAGSWIGWSGIPDHDVEPFEHSGIRQVPVGLTDDQYRGFYVGFCNGTLWPLYHSAVRPPAFHRHWWGPYQQVNRIFAEATIERLEEDDIAWIQDYQLQLVPGMLRDLGSRHRIGFYLHIPFPPVELFTTMPWRGAIVEGLLGSDVIAFQSRQSLANFIDVVLRLTDASVDEGGVIVWHDRRVQLQVAPIGIDAKSIARMSAEEEIETMARRVRGRLGDPKVVILGVDRLDYTKGIDHRMRALETLLERRADLIGKVSFVQVAVPSREDVAAYQEIREDIEGLVGRINGEYARIGRPPIHYLYRSLPMDELLAHYRAADVMLVTPLRDGMNLVAKEYVATRHDDTGVLVLSEFAGAAEELTEATLVNPYDIDGLARILESVVDGGWNLPNKAMAALRRSVESQDVFWWADRCLQALGL
jgi:trehalose 6-phosphate synthase